MNDQKTSEKSQAPEPSREDFATMLEESFGAQDGLVGSVLKGTVVDIENDMAIVDVGLKSEGRVPLKEFATQGKDPEVRVGDIVDVYLDRMENALGEAVISRERARREEAWNVLEKAYDKDERVEGVIFGRVKGGFTVDLGGAVAFLPGSQVDVRPTRDVNHLVGVPEDFQILKMDRRRGNIVVSRRAVLEETQAEQRSEILDKLEEGQVVEGVVKNITDYGAFVDLGGIDGLLHVTDMSWSRIGHPNEVLKIGDTIKVQVIKINPESQRISLGMKQLEADPWEGIESKYPVGTKFMGQVTNITDYGAFVELEPGVEGLVHVSEMSWTKKNVHPGKIVSSSQEVEVVVLDVDPEKRRISLGLKQAMDNPWETFAKEHPVGSAVEGEVKNITEFGLFIGLENDIDGMVHMSDIDWDKSGEEAIAEYKKGDHVKAQVLEVDPEKGRVGLGIKQLKDDPFGVVAGLKKGAIVTCTVSGIAKNGLEVEVGEQKFPAFIRRSDLSRERSEQRPDRFNVGDKIDARVTNIDRASRRINLSIKAREIAEEKEAMEQFGSTDAGASLGDILGAVIDEAREKTDGGKEEKSADKKKAASSKTAKDEEQDQAETAKDATADAEPESETQKAKKAEKKAESEDKEEKSGADEKKADDSAEAEDKKPAAKKSAAKKTSTAKKSTKKTTAKSSATKKTAAETKKADSTKASGGKKKTAAASSAADKKTTAKKTATKKTAAKKTTAKKTAAKKSSATKKSTTKKTASAKKKADK